MIRSNNLQDSMADLSKLSIAPNHLDLGQQHQAVRNPQSKSNRTVTRDTTSEFYTAASGTLNLQELGRRSTVLTLDSSLYWSTGQG